MFSKVKVSEKDCHFGIITFGPGAALHNNFEDKRFQNRPKLRELVRDKFKSIANDYGTRTDEALRLARDRLFVPRNGDRDDAANLLFLFTDGSPTGHKEKDFTPFKELTEDLEVDKHSVC